MGGQTRPALILERKIRLDGTVNEFACERLVLEPAKRAVLRYVLDRDWPLDAAGMVVAKGTITLAHYWTDRPYNVYHWLRDGRTLAIYCNVVDRTTIAGDQVSYEDLAVDVVIAPDGTATVMDEEELPPDLEPRRRAIVARAIEQITSSPLRLVREIEAESRTFL